MKNGLTQNPRGKSMFKILFSLLLLSSNLFAYSDGAWVAISSNSFGRVDIGSVTPTVIPSTSNVLQDVGSSNHVIFSTNSMREIIYTNMSSSVTVFFSSSHDAAWGRDNGTPIFAQNQLTVPVDPSHYFSTNTATRFFFVRDEGGGPGTFIPIRVWVRNTISGRD